VLERLKRAGIPLFKRVPDPARDVLVRVGSPSWTLGAVAWVVRPDDGRVLLVKPGYRTVWSLPGGLLGRHEDPATGVVREVLEETGLAVVITADPVVVVDRGRRIVDFVFEAAPADGTSLGAVRPGSFEVDDVAWVAPDEVEALTGELGPKANARRTAAELGTSLLVVDRRNGPARSGRAPL
jgi:ADP-ribose pyrophosphatase YjhB (NUDIX family)